MINGFEYCPWGYIKGGDYYFTMPSTAGIIRVRVLFEGGSYMRKYGMHFYRKGFTYRLEMPFQ